MCGGRGKGSRTRRSSNFAINLDFESSRCTCHVPRAKAVMGINAGEWLVMAGVETGERRRGRTKDYETGTVSSACADEIRWVVYYGHEIGVIARLLCSTQRGLGEVSACWAIGDRKTLDLLWECP
jgi:hypothetical protein